MCWEGEREPTRGGHNWNVNYSADASGMFAHSPASL